MTGTSHRRGSIPFCASSRAWSSATLKRTIDLLGESLGGAIHMSKSERRDLRSCPCRIRWCSSGALACLIILLPMALPVEAQDKNPFAGDAKAAKVGESQFRANCSFCHGLGARGGGRGPDLTRAQKRHGNSD